MCLVLSVGYPRHIDQRSTASRCSSCFETSREHFDVADPWASVDLAKKYPEVTTGVIAYTLTEIWALHRRRLPRDPRRLLPARPTTHAPSRRSDARYATAIGPVAKSVAHAIARSSPGKV